MVANIKLMKNNSKSKERRKTVESLLSKYKGQYGEYKYYAGQTFVFRDKDVCNKTLLISKETPNHNNRPYLKFRARPVYTGDTIEDLQEVIRDWKEETDWYSSEFGNIPSLVMPEEKYSICDDPMGTGQKTVLISTKWIDNIQGDIFRIDSKKLHSYTTKYAEFKKTLIELIKKFLELSEKDIYPDFLGEDNIAIYLDEKDIPHIALIDRHIVWIGKHCREDVKKRLDNAIAKLKKMSEDLQMSI